MRISCWTLPPALALGVTAFAALSPGGDNVAPDDAEAGAVSRVAEAPRGPSLLGHVDGSIDTRAEGSCTLVGRVRRRGAPAAASVEVYFLAARRGGTVFNVEGPEAWARRFDPVNTMPPAVRTAAGADGAFVVRGLAPGDYRVTAVGADGAHDVASVSLRLLGQRRDLRLDLEEFSETLEGVVRFEDGRPWDGLVYAVTVADRDWWVGPLPGDGAPVRCGPDGRFSVGGLPLGRVRVWAIGEVEGASFKAFGDAAWLPRREDYVFVVDAGLSWVGGRVLGDDDGRPLRGAVVTAAASTGAEGTQTWTRTTAGDEGAFRVLARSGSTAIEASAPGYASASATAGDGDVLLLLTRAGSVFGRVTTPDGAPVAGVGVIATDALKGSSVGVSGGDGLYEILSMRAGAVGLSVRGEGFTAKSIGGVAAEGFHASLARGGAVRADVVVEPGVTVSGRAVDPKGDPVPGARIVAYEYNPENEAFADSSTMEAVAAKDGAFSIGGLSRACGYGLRGWAPDLASAFVIVERPGHAPVEVRLLPRRSLDLRVVAGDGGTPAAAEVWVGGSHEGWTHARIDDTGSAHVEGLGPGSMRVYVYASGHLDSDQTIGDDSDPFRAFAPLTIRLRRARTIAGRVLFEDGSPAARASAILDGSDGWVGAGPDGSFAFLYATEGAHTLKAQAPAADGTTAQIEAEVAAGDAHVVVTLPGSPAPAKVVAPEVLVLVLDGEGRPVPSAQLEFTREGGGESRDVRAGRSSVPGGAYEFYVRGARSSSGSALPLGVACHGPVEPGSGPIEVRLPPEQVIEGRVLGPDGSGLAGVNVTIDAAGAEAWTDAMGCFRLGGLSADACSLAVKPPRGYVAPRSVDAVAGGPPVVVTVKRAAQVEVRVLDVGGEPVANARVEARSPGRAREVIDEETGVVTWRDSPGASRGSAATDTEGWATLDGLDPGSAYVFTASPPHRRSGLYPVEQEGTAPGRVVVRLVPAYGVSGRVVDQHGEGVVGAHVWASGGGESQQGLTGPDGTFAFLRLPDGPVELMAAASTDGPWCRRQESDGESANAVEVRAGATGVAVRVHVADSLVVRIAGWDPRDGPASAYLREETGEDGEVRGPYEVGRHVAVAAVDAEGYSRFQNPPAGRTCLFWVPPRSDGRYALERGLASRGSHVVVPLRRGLTIEGRLVAPEGASQLRVRACGGGISIEGTVTRDGRFEVRGLPPGRYEIRAQARSREDPWSSSALVGTAEAAAGGDAVITLEPPVDEPDFVGQSCG